MGAGAEVTAGVACGLPAGIPTTRPAVSGVPAIVFVGAVPSTTPSLTGTATPDPLACGAVPGATPAIASPPTTATTAPTASTAPKASGASAVSLATFGPSGLAARATGPGPSAAGFPCAPSSGACCAVPSEVFGSDARTPFITAANPAAAPDCGTSEDPGTAARGEAAPVGGNCITSPPRGRCGGWPSAWTAVPTHHGSGWSGRERVRRSLCHCRGRWRCVRRRN
jgi:hypothetical protein